MSDNNPEIGSDISPRAAEVEPPAAVVHAGGSAKVEAYTGASWPDDWKRNGFNGAIVQAQRALRYLADNDRPVGGEQFPNAACCQMIAHDLEITRERYAATALCGAKTGMGVTGNAILLLGFIAGVIDARSADCWYELVDVDAASGTQVLRNVANGNTFRVSVVQLEGTE